MTEWLWAFLVVWIFVLVFSNVRKDKNIQSLASMIGIIFGVLYLTSSAILGLAMIVINLYLVYDALE